MATGVAAVAVNLQIVIGDAYAQQFAWKDSAGAPIDLTGWTGQAQARTTIDDTSALLTFTVTLGGVAGTITLTLTSGQTAGFANGQQAVWDVLLTPASGPPVRLIGGQVSFVYGVTR